MECIKAGDVFASAAAGLLDSEVFRLLVLIIPFHSANASVQLRDVKETFR
ncbi:MAG TPA: hypothetical protein VNN73_16355 [Blastocatellia bacterium]|nr:hypothetical protein [Blastocatellia bacterium]